MYDYNYTLQLPPTPPKLNGKFPKNHHPWNKGKKWKKNFKNGFQIGNLPKNTLPVGSKRMKDGIWYIKTAMPKTWTNLNRYIWEQQYGTIPQGMIVRTKPGAPNDHNIKNLICVDRSENMCMNTNRVKAGKSISRRNMLKRRLPEIETTYGLKFQTLKT